MTIRHFLRAGAFVSGLLLAACGNQTAAPTADGLGPNHPRPTERSHLSGDDSTWAPQSESSNSTVWDMFSNNTSPDVQIAVNKYLWNASLEVLNFLPIETVDPFSGLIVTGYGTPAGGGRAYRATIHITDPALDARSLKVALESRGGAVSADTVRAVEDAILTRARQMRIADSNL